MGYVVLLIATTLGKIQILVATFSHYSTHMYKFRYALHCCDLTDDVNMTLIYSINEACFTLL